MIFFLITFNGAYYFTSWASDGCMAGVPSIPWSIIFHPFCNVIYICSYIKLASLQLLIGFKQWGIPSKRSDIGRSRRLGTWSPAASYGGCMNLAVHLHWWSLLFSRFNVYLTLYFWALLRDLSSPCLGLQ